jgi:excinuclease ABC subunit A
VRQIDRSANGSATTNVRVRGAREHNLKNVDVDIPRGALVVFTGVSGSGKSSLAFSTLYAEAQRRYLETVSPYARRLFHQMPVPDVDEIDGLRPAVALQQQRGTPTARSSVGSVSTISNLLRMLYSRAGTYPARAEHLAAEAFSPNTPAGACPRCTGLGRIYDVTERSMVPDPSLTIRERAIAAWPTAWHGQNLRDIAVTLGYDVDRPWRELPKKDRDWLLFTDEHPTVPVYAGYTPAETHRALKRKEEASYLGTFTGARRYVLDTFAKSQSPLMKKRAERYLVNSLCPACHGKRLRPESLAVTFAAIDIAEMARLPLARLSALMEPFARAKSEVVARISAEVVARVSAIVDLGLGYLTLERSTPTLSPGELQRLRIATQVHSTLFGVVYVLDEPSAGLHPRDTQALLRALDRLKAAGNSLFVVEHDLDVVRHADWIVDVGPGAGVHGGRIVYSGEPAAFAAVTESETARYLFERVPPIVHEPRTPRGWLLLRGVTRHNVRDVDADFPLGVLTSVTGISGSGKSSLVSGALVDIVAAHLGGHAADEAAEPASSTEREPDEPTDGTLAGGLGGIRRLVRVDQKPIGRTPRSNLATYTGLFDEVRARFAATKAARARHFSASRFSFNLPKGRCPTCEGEGSVMVELLFLPSVYSPCPSCHGARYNPEALAVRYRGKTIADVLALTVDDAQTFFADDAPVRRALDVLVDVGLGYLRLGQPATEFSGGEAQRVRLATELQRSSRGDTLYVLDEPTTGLHPADVDRLMEHLGRLVDAGNTVIVVEHDRRVIARSDWVIDIGPGAGDDGGRIVSAGATGRAAIAV